jgi:tetratricopeptide (TPR) repeat protein
VWIEAARSFHEALRRDPKLGMAWVGIARAEMGLYQKRHAREAIARAKALAEGTSERERLNIDLREQQIEGALAFYPEQAKLHEKYKAALDKAIALDPGDAEMWVLRGNAEEESISGRGQRGEIGSIAFYEAALRRSPDHLGAHHYLVHSYENVKRPLEAIAHGRIYAAAAPNVAHAQHMLAHVLPRVGKWTEALEQFRKADHIETEYETAEKVRPGDDWHHVHNLDLLGYSYLRLGRIDDAEKTFRRRWAVPTPTPLRAGLNVTWPEMLLLLGRFDEALVASRELVASPDASKRTVGWALAVEAHLGLGRREEAKEAAKRAAEALKEGTSGPTLGAHDFAAYYGKRVRHVEAEIAIDGPDSAEATRKLMAVTDEYAGSTHIDAIGNLFTLERLAAQMRRMSKPELAAAIEGKMKRIDAEYHPRTAAPSP